MDTKALGIIEVIGFITAIEVADAALKAANVHLIGISKVSGGIVDVQITGDIGAVEAASKVGGSAAEKIGQLRSVHVIPRMHPDVEKMVLPKRKKEVSHELDKPLSQKKSNINNQLEHSLKNEEAIDIEVSSANHSNQIMIEKSEEKEKPTSSETDTEQTVQSFRKELSIKSNKELKKIINDLGIKIDSKKLKTAKKDDLIQFIINDGEEV